MHRLTTDTPKDNFEMALNLFYVKDEEVWARGYGKDGADISLLNLTREILSHQCPYVESDISDDDLIMMIPEWLFDDVRETEHVIGLLYQAAWVCAELREHLKQFEDSKLSPEDAANLYAILRLGDGMTLMRLRELAVADQEGRVTILPCRGDADIVLMRNGVDFKPDHWNIHLTTFAENQPTPSGKKVALFDLREVLELMEGKKDD